MHLREARHGISGGANGQQSFGLARVECLGPHCWAPAVEAVNPRTPGYGLEDLLSSNLLSDSTLKDPQPQRLRQLPPPTHTRASNVKLPITRPKDSALPRTDLGELSGIPVRSRTALLMNPGRCGTSRLHDARRCRAWRRGSSSLQHGTARMLA